MRYRLLTLLVAACSLAGAAPPPGEAGWRDVLDTPALKSPLAARSLLNGLARAGERIVAVGARGHILTSDDAGKTWTQAEVPASSDLVAVAFGDATQGWAVGHDGLVLHSADAGRSWTRQLDGRQLGAQGIENPLLDVWFQDAHNGYVVGAFGTILRTRDGGASWQSLAEAADNPKGLHLYAVRGIGDDVYMVGEQGLVLKLDRASGRLRALDLPYKGTLFGIAADARGLVVHGLRGTVLRSADGGQSWQTVATGVQAGLTANARTADGRIVLASLAGHLLAAREDGSFAALKLELPLPAAALVAAPPATLVVAGPRGVRALPLP